MINLSKRLSFWATRRPWRLPLPGDAGGHHNLSDRRCPHINVRIYPLEDHENLMGEIYYDHGNSRSWENIMIAAIILWQSMKMDQK